MWADFRKRENTVILMPKWKSGFVACRECLPPLGSSLARPRWGIFCPRLAARLVCGCGSKVASAGADTAHSCSCWSPGRSTPGTMWGKDPDGWGSSASAKGCCRTSPRGWLDLPCAWWEPLQAFPKGCVLLAAWTPEGLAQFSRIHTFGLIYLEPLQILKFFPWGRGFFITACNRLLSLWGIHPHGHRAEPCSACSCLSSLGDRNTITYYPYWFIKQRKFWKIQLLPVHDRTHPRHSRVLFASVKY